MSENATIRDPWKEIEKLQHHVELYRRLWHEAKKREEYWQSKYNELHEGLQSLVKRMEAGK